MLHSFKLRVKEQQLRLCMASKTAKDGELEQLRLDIQALKSNLQGYETAMRNAELELDTLRRDKATLSAQSAQLANKCDQLERLVIDKEAQNRQARTTYIADRDELMADYGRAVACMDEYNAEIVRMNALLAKAREEKLAREKENLRRRLEQRLTLVDKLGTRDDDDDDDDGASQ